jgi:O-succinylbenzoic acid--CoA ligase
VIEWLRRHDPDRVFLRAGDQAWTYADAVAEVERRLGASPRLSIVTLQPESVFELIAGISSGGITAVGPQPEAKRAFDSDLVVFTSGTTGIPKGVRLTRLNLTAAASASAEHLGNGPDDDWLLAMPMHHVGGISIVVRQAYTGGSVTLHSGFDPERFTAAIRGPVTMVSVVPTMLARLIDHGPYSGLRAVLVGGGPIPPGLLEAAAGAGLPVLPTYGMTETFGQVATLRPGAPLAYRVHPLPGVEFRTDGNGRIAVKGAQVSPGYAGEPDRKDPWFVTSDFGEIDEEGALRILGRADTVIVTGGENVSPERVESVVRDHRGVDEVVVVGAPDPEWGEKVVCVYAGSVTPEDLRSWVSERLPRFMVPKRFVPVESIPRTALGKPDRSAVESLV